MPSAAKTYAKVLFCPVKNEVKSKVSPSIDVDDMLGAVEAERQIASEKEELEKSLKELRELKSVLQMFMEDLETAIGAECKAEGALKAAAESCDNVVVGISKAIVDAEQNTVFKAEISPECLAQLRQLLEDCIAKERQLLEEHRALQFRMLEEHEVNRRTKQEQSQACLSYALQGGGRRSQT